MGIQDLQTFLESTAVEGGSVSVDLLRLSRNIVPQLNKQYPNKNKQQNKYNGNKLKLVLDAECCLDRLYGGYFSDWACGGQWNRTVQFLSLFMHAIEGGNIELAVIFNGALEQQRMSDWIAEQTKIRQRINQVLKHLNQKGTPPPKVWWCPPTCLRTVLRMALRHLNTTVLCSMDDHHQEVIAYCRENGFHGLIADDAEYAAFDPPRYFSSENLKLTYKGSLETKEFMVSEMTKILKLTHEQLCVLAALLGNYLLPESDLIEVYRKVGISFTPNRPTSEQLVRSLAEFVGTLPPVSQLDTLITQILGSIDDKRASALRQTIQYYLNGTADGFLKYRTATTRRPDLHSLNKKRTVSSTSGVSSGTGSAVCVNSGTTTNTNHNSITSGISSRSEDNDLDTSGFASETTEREQKSLEDYKLATKHIAQMTPEIIIEQSSSDGESLSLPSQTSSAEKSPRTDDKYDSTQSSEQQSPHLNGPSTNGTSTQSQTAATTSTISLLAAGSSSASTSGASSMNTSPRHLGPTDKLRVSVEVMRTATERHQKGLMSPIIYHTLVSNEVRLPCVMEDEQHREFPAVHLIFRPVRQKVYAIIFNLHHLQYLANKSRAEAQAEGHDVSAIHTPEVHVKEWTWSKGNQYQKADVVKAEPLGWAVPTIQRLWFGSTVDDKRRRLRAFLTCMNSDSSFMLNPSYVPQHMLILACVLRYIMSHSDKCILRKQELDAFIAQAFAPELMNSQYLQELTLPSVSSRGVQLAALFMHGVETALLANDACGAPIPWLMSCPWLYLDGKLFHYTLIRAGHVKNLLELCENHIDRVVKVERMRKAILEGLDVQFAKPPLPPLSGLLRSGMPPPNCLPPVNLPSTRGPAGLARRPVPARGGQLQVAGVVVGQWGANYGFSHQIRPQQMNAAATYAIGRGRGNIPQNPSYPVAGRGYAMQQNKPNRGPTWSTNKKVVNNKKKNPTKKGNKGRGLTVQLSSGETVLGSELLKNEIVKTEEVVEDPTIFEDAINVNSPKQIDHKGQGDGPTSAASPTTTTTPPPSQEQPHPPPPPTVTVTAATSSTEETNETVAVAVVATEVAASNP